ncbi:MAG: uroporphyrinogen decarboxylase family protein [Thermoguttaceae bacterium]
MTTSSKMVNKNETLYNERLKRYTTAMRNEKPDRVPVRPFAAEVTAVHAGFTCQQVTHDYRYAFEAIIKCCRDFDWDATVPNMVYVWTGLAKTLGLRYYATPGIEISPDTGFQYMEPSEKEAWMREDEYDEFTRSPIDFLANVWFPRVAQHVAPPGMPATFRGNMAMLSGMAAMKNYFAAFGPHVAQMRDETGTPCAISGILKAPFDIIADKFRGYKALCMDMFRRPEKVIALTEALTPHLAFVAEQTSDPNRQLPVGLWLHRGCLPFLSPQQFEKFFWPSLKEIICHLWSKGIQTLFYAEGEWNGNLKYIAELPEKSIIYHVDRGDIFEVHRAVGDKFCLSGGIPNDILAFGTPDDVRNFTRKVIEGVGQDGGYIVDACAIMQNDTKIENLCAMTQAARDFGTY